MSLDQSWLTPLLLYLLFAYFPDCMLNSNIRWYRPIVYCVVEVAAENCLGCCRRHDPFAQHPYVLMASLLVYYSWHGFLQGSRHCHSAIYRAARGWRRRPCIQIPHSACKAWQTYRYLWESSSPTRNNRSLRIYRYSPLLWPYRCISMVHFVREKLYPGQYADQKGQLIMKTRDVQVVTRLMETWCRFSKYIGMVCS